MLKEGRDPDERAICHVLPLTGPLTRSEPPGSADLLALATNPHTTSHSPPSHNMHSLLQLARLVVPCSMPWPLQQAVSHGLVIHPEFSRHASFSNVSTRPLLALLTFALHAVSATPANPTHTHMKQDVLATLEGKGLHTPGRSTPFVLAAPLSAPLALQVLREVSVFWPTSHALVRTHALTMPLSLPHIHTTQTPRRRRVVGSRAPEQVSVGASDFFRFSPSSTSPPLPDLGQRAG